MHELNTDYIRELADAPDARSSLPTRAPQRGDNDKVLLAKIATSLVDLRLAGKRSGVLLDEGGLPRKVWHSALKNIAASQTDAAVVTAVTGYAIRVVSVYALAGATATTLTFNSKPAGSGVAISPLLANAANGGEVLPHNDHGWFETEISEGLTVTTGAGATTGFQVNYILVPNYLTDEFGIVLTDEDGTPLISP